MLAGSMLLTAGLLIGILLRSYAGLLCLWFLIGLGVSLTLTPALYMIRRISGPSDLQTLLAAQFSISSVLMVAAYAGAGWLAVIADPWATAFVLGVVAACASLVAVNSGRREAAMATVPERPFTNRPNGPYAEGSQRDDRPRSDRSRRRCPDCRGRKVAKQQRRIL